MDISELLKTASLHKIEQLHRDGLLGKDAPTKYTALASSLALGKTDITRFLVSTCKLDLASKQLLIPARDASLDTPLHHAARWGDYKLMLSLLPGQKPLTADADGNTALHLAFIHERGRIVDCLLKMLVIEKRYENTKNKLGLSYLHIACSRRNKEAIEELSMVGSAADTVSSESVMWAGNNALHFATMNGSVPAMQVLFKQPDWRSTLDIENAAGVRPSKTVPVLATEKLILNGLGLSDKRFSHFHLACTQPNPTEVKRFLDSGVDINERVSSDFCLGDTPLHCAVRSNCSDNVAMILQRKPDVSSRNGDGMTPLHLAMYGEQEVIVDTLYKVTTVDSEEKADANGLNLFHVACSRNDLETAKKLLGSCKRQLNAQVLYDRRVFSRYTALHFAVQKKHLEMIEWLIQNGANVNLGADGVDGTPLHMAFDLRHVGIVKLLLKKGADRKAVRSVDKKTTLHLLVNWCTDKSEFEKAKPLLSYIERLVKDGVDVDAQDADGNTALHLAAAKGQLGCRCVQLLLEHGADVNQLNHRNDTPFNVFLKADFDWKLQEKPGDYTLLYHHVQKLNTLGLRVDARNEHCCDWLTSDKNPHYTKKEYKSCVRQLDCILQKMIDEKVKLQGIALDASPPFSMYDFVTGNVKKAAAYVKSNVFLELANAKEYDKKFPIYGYLVKLRYRQAVKFNSGGTFGK